mgnify:CR=1 FL=1
MNTRHNNSHLKLLVGYAHEIVIDYRVGEAVTGGHCADTCVLKKNVGSSF